MRFEDFASAHGLILRHVDFGRWIRCSTTDHPHKKNGSYKHLGDVAFVQNHATMTEPAVWFPEKESDIRIDLKRVEIAKRKAKEELESGRRKAASSAKTMLDSSVLEQHAYLDAKGFPDMRGLVFYKDEATNLLIIPMKVQDQIVGAQTITREGEKKFIFGQRCSGAEFRIGSGGAHFWCEGYATGLSIHAALTAAKITHIIHVCFSAGNMQSMATAFGAGFVIADNDQSRTGLKAAQATGLPYFMPPKEGDDFNDLHRAQGLFRASQALRKFMQEAKRKAI